MNKLFKFLNDSVSGKNPVNAIQIHTADIKVLMRDANTDFSFVKFWLAGYYQTLRTMKAMGFVLSVEETQDFNNVKAFLKQFDGNIEKWAEIRTSKTAPETNVAETMAEGAL